MSLIDRIEQFQGSLTTAAGVGVVSLILAGLRRAFTIQRQIDLMKMDINHREKSRIEDNKHRDQSRAEDRELILKVHADVVDMRNHIMSRDN
jgi:hypothetical protein